MSVTELARAQPHRVMVLSADMGGGHNATAAALEDSVRRLWPGTQTTRLDTLDLMGPGVGRLFRRIYVANVEQTPWLYEFFYSALWRHRWFARSCKRFTGSWSGRQVGCAVDRFDPDLVLSTFPLGSAGLAWSRTHRHLQTPVGAFVSDFAPHPFWVHRQLDATFVVHESAVPVGLAAEPQADVRVCALPAGADFVPGDRDAARRACGLDPSAFIVLVSSGAYAFGDVTRTVMALLGASEDVQVVVACGRNELTLAAMQRLALPPRQLVPLGWTSEMPTLIRACDVVVSNAGGAITLEALACGRAVLVHRPIAAHGRANAELMLVAGLCELTTDEGQLQTWVRSAITDPEPVHELEAQARLHVQGHDLAQDLTALTGSLTGRVTSRVAHDAEVAPPARAASEPGWRLRPSDAFFVNVETGGVAQELGAVLELDERPPAAPITPEALRELVQARLPGLPPLRRMLLTTGRARWRLLDDVDVSRHVTHRKLVGATDGTIDEAIDRFWSTRLPRDRPPWSMLLLHSEHEGRCLLAMKMHHGLGDGVSALGLLDRLLDADATDPLPERGPAHEVRGAPWVRPRWRDLRSMASGLVSLALRSPPARHHLNRTDPGPGRMLVTVAVDRQRVQQLARDNRAHVHEVAIAVLAEALATVLGETKLVDTESPLRVMVPVAQRPPRLDRVFGNWTGSVALDLPVGPSTFSERLTQVRSEMRARMIRGEGPAGNLVVQIIARLPHALSALLTRSVYTRRFFSSIISFMPGARGRRWVAGAEVRAVYPVVPLAKGVPLAAGVVLSGGTAGFGVFLDAKLELTRERISQAVRSALEKAEREHVRI